MSKKYSPSGYQIIHLDCVGRTSSTPFTPETEDEKLLLQILKEPLMKDRKPILIKCIDTSGDVWMAFANYYSGSLTLTSGYVGGSSQLIISYTSTQLAITLHEE